MAFYRAAFGAELYRVGGTDEHEEVVDRLSVGNASWVADESPPHRRGR